METLIQNIPAWVGALGLPLLLVGFFLRKKALVNQTMHTKTNVNGESNSINNHISQSVSPPNLGGDSTLSKWGNWASLIGFALTLWPVIRTFLPSLGN